MYIFQTIIEATKILNLYFLSSIAKKNYNCELYGQLKIILKLFYLETFIL